MIIGIPSEQHVGIDLWQAMSREIAIHVQKRSNGNDHDAIEMMRRGLIRADSILTHCFPLRDGSKAFKTMAEYSDGVVKPVVEL